MTETPHTLDKVAIRMVKEPPLYSSTPVRSPDDAVRLMAEMLKGYDREVFCIVNFRNDMTPINMNIVSMGTLNASLVHPLTIAYWVNGSMHSESTTSATPSSMSLFRTVRMIFRLTRSRQSACTARPTPSMI